MSGPSRIESTSSGKCDPICQFFINSFGKQTRYTLVNFASFYSPAKAKPCRFGISLYDAAGIRLVETDVTVPSLGSAEFVPQDHFDIPLPDLGLIAIELADHDEQAYMHLGLLRPYFYAVFHDREMRSIAVVHPQTNLLFEPIENRGWQSNLAVRSADVDGLEVYQLNPLADTRETSVVICDVSGKTLVESRASMAPRSARRMYWSVSEFCDSEYVTLASHCLTGPNAKPLLVQHHNGGFSASHS